MLNRRAFLSGLTVSGLLPFATWADAGAPDFLSAARAPGGRYRLAGLTQTGAMTFDVPLPGRGHAAAAHPSRPLAVAFARRPGTFAVVIDCATGRQIATLDAPAGRHFYGHGTFSADGTRLFTPENDFEAGQGIIGVWDTNTGFTRRGEFSSGGIGPHDVALLPDGETLAVANGGIETHPDTGRAKLNLPTMRPNLSYLALDGRVLEQVELAPELHKNSIRHLAIRDDGAVAFAMQWQGESGTAPPLLAIHQRGTTPDLLSAPKEQHRHLNGYAGSVAFSTDGTSVAITSPKGGAAHIFDTNTKQIRDSFSSPDICGVGSKDAGFFFTTGQGVVAHWKAHHLTQTDVSDLQWDNHLVAISH